MGQVGLLLILVVGKTGAGERRKVFFSLWLIIGIVKCWVFGVWEMDSWFFGLETSITSNMIPRAIFSSSASPLYANAGSIHLMTVVALLHFNTNLCMSYRC